MDNTSESPLNLSANEGIKEKSNFLRGTILEGLSDLSTGALASDDTQLTKFHGIYQQDDRDLRSERRKQKQEKAYSFMIRIRVPGGIFNPNQRLMLDELADDYANGSIRLTTRQAIQYHGVVKANLKSTIQGINKACFDTIAACGDVNRNVMCNSNAFQSPVHHEVGMLASAISQHLTPKTSAYHEIWLDEEKVLSSKEVHEPVYGKTYLPRKFKIGMAIPPHNDIDAYSQDLSFIAIIEKGELVGFNVAVGGGMGMSHNKEKTYPRLADLLGFCKKEQVIEVAEKVVLVQRDYGDRSNRAHARLKYTIDDRGLDWFRNELEERLGFNLEDCRSFEFNHTGDSYGWVKGIDEKWNFTLFIQSGRVEDSNECQLKTGLSEIAKVHKGEFRLTPNQNLIISGISKTEKPRVEELLNKYALLSEEKSGLRLNSMACVALPTCGLALAESERYLPDLLNELEVILEKAGLREDEIIIRMTGCPNGCARPYLGEIGLVGRAPRKYNLYLGAGFSGDRLSKLYKESVVSDQIAGTLEPIIRHYASSRQEGERFGDFAIRKGYVSAIKNSKNDFWN